MNSNFVGFEFTMNYFFITQILEIIIITEMLITLFQSFLNGRVNIIMETCYSKTPIGSQVI